MHFQTWDLFRHLLKVVSTPDCLRITNLEVALNSLQTWREITDSEPALPPQIVENLCFEPKKVPEGEKKPKTCKTFYVLFLRIQKIAKILEILQNPAHYRTFVSRRSLHNSNRYTYIFFQLRVIEVWLYLTFDLSVSYHYARRASCSFCYKNLVTLNLLFFL